MDACDMGNGDHEGFLIMLQGELPIAMFWPWHTWKPCSVMQLRGPIVTATGALALALALSKC